jgi:hypothetical protein
MKEAVEREGPAAFAGTGRIIRQAAVDHRLRRGRRSRDNAGDQGDITVARYRVSCPNPKCDCIGPMEGTPSGGYVKQHFVDLNRKKHGGADPCVQLKLRCPICKHRWRARPNAVHAW